MRQDEVSNGGDGHVPGPHGAAPHGSPYVAAGPTGAGSTGAGPGGPTPTAQERMAWSRPLDEPGPAKSSRSPFRRRWWTIPKIVIAGVVAVLLAGAGGGAIGYGIGEAGAQHLGPGIGRYGHHRGNFGPYGGLGGGSGSQLPGQAPSGSDSGNNP